MKIQIIGASGTGKSTLAKHIGTQVGIKVIEADRYLWADEFFTVNHPIPKRFEMYEQDIKDGAYVADTTFGMSAMIIDSNQPAELLSKAIFRQMQKAHIT